MPDSASNLVFDAALALPCEAVVAVIGAGTMGSGIAQVAAKAGHRVLLFDTRGGAAEEALRRVADDLARLVAKGRLDEQAARAIGSRIACVHAIGDCVSADLVIEAVVEDLQAKRELLLELERVVGERAILASNTSSFSITALAAKCRHPGRIAGFHFFNPAPVLPLVEVISGLATSQDVLRTLYATAQAWGKKPVHAKSTPGFIVNRCARPFYGEALRLLAERAGDPATIDGILREAGGFRMGPFELMDLIGNDVNFAVTQSVWQATFHDPRYRPSVIQQDMVAGGLLGRKSGRGFYAYGGDAQPVCARTETACEAPAAIVVHGDSPAGGTLAERMRASGIEVRRAAAHATLGDGVIAQTDGRTATQRAVDGGVRDLVVYDLALDYASCRRIAIAWADGCRRDLAGAAVGALQKCGMQVTQVDDVAGLCVMRTVALLANEAADAVTQGIASAGDIDAAMRDGLNYPRGPLAWADDIGVPRVRDVIRHLAQHYGDGRYRVAPLVARCAASGMRLGTA